MTAPRIILGKTLPEWARETGIRPSTLRARIDLWGWTEAEAVGLVPHASLRGKCRGKAVTIAYKKKVDREPQGDHNGITVQEVMALWR